MSKLRGAIRRQDNVARSRFFIRLLIVGNILILIGAVAYVGWKGQGGGGGLSAFLASSSSSSGGQGDEAHATMTAEELVAEATRMVREGDLGPAEELLEKYRYRFNVDIQNAERFNLLGVIDLRRDRPLDASSRFLAAIRQSPKNPVYYINLNESYREAGFHGLALGATRMAIERLDPNPMVEAKHLLTACEAGDVELVEVTLAERTREGRLESHLGLVKAAILYHNGQARKAAGILHAARGAMSGELYQLLSGDPYVTDGLKELVREMDETQGVAGAEVK